MNMQFFLRPLSRIADEIERETGAPCLFQVWIDDDDLLLAYAGACSRFATTIRDLALAGF